MDDEREREPNGNDHLAEQAEDSEDSDVSRAVEDEVDEASDQSFPASDPPAY